MKELDILISFLLCRPANNWTTYIFADSTSTNDAPVRKMTASGHVHRPVAHCGGYLLTVLIAFSFPPRTAVAAGNKDISNHRRLGVSRCVIVAGDGLISLSLIAYLCRYGGFHQTRNLDPQELNPWVYCSLFCIVVTLPL